MKKPSASALKKQVDAFNKKHKPAQKVNVQMDDGSVREVTIASPATILSGHSAMGWFDEISGCYDLNRVITGQYPIIDEHREHYVYYPVLVSEEASEKFPGHIPAGSWVAACVLLTGGYRHLPTPVGHFSFDECNKGCENHNKYHGWDRHEVSRIISASMGIKFHLHTGMPDHFPPFVDDFDEGIDAQVATYYEKKKSR